MKPAGYERTLAYRWARLRYLVSWRLRIYRSDAGVLLDDVLAWVRSWRAKPNVSDAHPYWAFSNRTQRERLVFHIGVARPERQVDALIERCRPPRLPIHQSTPQRRHLW